MKHNKHIIITALLVWLLVSFVPQISLMTLIGKGKGKSGG